MDLPSQELLRDAKSLLSDAIQLRRRLHLQPELGLELPKTRRAVLESLEGLDLKVSECTTTSGVAPTSMSGTATGLLRRKHPLSSR